MSKKKSKKAKKLVMPISVVALVVIVAILIITMTVTPNQDRLVKGFEKKGQTTTPSGVVDKKPTIGIGDVDAAIAGFNISSNPTVFAVTYYTTSEKAKEVYKETKANNKDENIVVARRGNAVYVGSKSIAGTFKYQIG